MAPLALRQQAWERLAVELDPAALDRMTSEVTLEETAEAARRLMEGRVRGRVVVRIRT
jgi:acrylyl-CoA reductase (NADPH)